MRVDNGIEVGYGMINIVGMIVDVCFIVTEHSIFKLKGTTTRGRYLIKKYKREQDYK